MSPGNMFHLLGASYLRYPISRHLYIYVAVFQIEQCLTNKEPVYTYKDQCYRHILILVSDNPGKTILTPLHFCRFKCRKKKL